jgi:hypothetical protein
MGSYSLTLTSLVKRTSDGVYIPNDPKNNDWVAYQTWLGAGNIPDPYFVTLTPQQQFSAALANGINTIWTPSSSLNGVYAIDSQTQFNITAETVTILTIGTFSNGSTSRYWLNQNGQPMLMNVVQFKAFAMAVSTYVDGLYAVLAALQAGQINTPWPNNQATINA